MHCMIAWGLESGHTDTEHDQALEKSLEGHAWARAFPAAYVVALIYGEQERQEIVDKLVAGAKELGLDDFALLVSPVAQADSGTYEGWLDMPLWDKINQFTDGRRVKG